MEKIQFSITIESWDGKLKYWNQAKEKLSERDRRRFERLIQAVEKIIERDKVEQLELI
jgi:molecular chaperone DnaK (HSP70)